MSSGLLAAVNVTDNYNLLFAIIFSPLLVLIFLPDKSEHQ